MQRYDVSPYPGLEPELGLLVAALEDGTREWRKNLEHPSQEAVVWQPYPNGPSIGGIILHLASCEWYWLRQFVLGEAQDPNDVAVAYDQTMDQYVPYWPGPPDEPIEWYFSLHDQARKRTIEAIREHGNPTEELPRKENVVTYRWIVAHLQEHDSYHGGQAVLLHEMWKQIRS